MSLTKLFCYVSLPVGQTLEHVKTETLYNAAVTHLNPHITDFWCTVCFLT